MNTRATIERLEALLEIALQQQLLTGQLRVEIAELDLIVNKVDPNTRARIERLVLLIGFVPNQGVVATGAPQFKKWTCAAFGTISNNAAGVPRFKRWTCTAFGSVSVNATGAPLTKKWTCTASGQIGINATGAPLTKRWTCVAVGQITINATGAPLTKKWTCAASGAVTQPDPTTVFGTNLVLWLRGDSLVDAGGGAVQTWTDKSTFGNSPTAPAPANRPTIVAAALGGRAAASFAAGAAKRLVKTAGTNLALVNCTIYAVWKRNDDSSAFRCFAGMDTFAPEWGTQSGHPGFYASGTQFPATLTLAANTYAFQEVTKPDSLPGGVVHIYLNGVENTPAPTNSGWPAATSSTITIGSGSNGSGDDLGPGEIAEIILVDRPATPSESATIRNYINAYYGTSF